MQDLLPTPPKNLNPLARELLESLAGHAEAAEIVLGGGVALSHYLEYRDTMDVDAWWRLERREEVSITSQEERERAETLRRWYRSVFCATTAP